MVNNKSGRAREGLAAMDTIVAGLQSNCTSMQKRLTVIEKLLCTMASNRKSALPLHTPSTASTKSSRHTPVVPIANPAVSLATHIKSWTTENYPLLTSTIHGSPPPPLPRVFMAYPCGSHRRTCCAPGCTHRTYKLQGTTPFWRVQSVYMSGLPEPSNFFLVHQTLGTGMKPTCCYEWWCFLKGARYALSFPSHDLDTVYVQIVATWLFQRVQRYGHHSTTRTLGEYVSVFDAGVAFWYNRRYPW